MSGNWIPRSGRSAAAVPRDERCATSHPLVRAALEAPQHAPSGALEAVCGAASYDELVLTAAALDALSKDAGASAYQRVRALFQTHAVYRYYLPRRRELEAAGTTPFDVQKLIQSRRFREALAVLAQHPLTASTASARASAYQGLGYQILAEQVQQSVRALPGNQWMFRARRVDEYPLRVHHRLLRAGPDGEYPVLSERTPVRMDLSHSGWSDIFALAMEFPEGARVINISVDLAVSGSGEPPRPPIECALRVIDQPILRLCSVDLSASAELESVADVFDYARDHLGLLKAALVASGIVPPGFEASRVSLAEVLHRLLGPGRGLELVSHVRDIPKGSRLAVSTNLLASLIAVCMRATEQLGNLTGSPTEEERRHIAARAILGEWLAGSGGGWQDSAGIWPGIKTIEGVLAREGDVEHGSSRGCLLPAHTALDLERVPALARSKLLESLVVVHGGLIANVGPILEVVTEKFMLGGEAEWRARQQLMSLHTVIFDALRRGDVRALARATTLAFEGPVQVIVPAASNPYTERLIEGAREAFGDAFWGFWMMGGMSGGGMGFIFDPAVRARAESTLLGLMQREKRALERSIPFGMDPIAYNVAINQVGTTASLHTSYAAALPTEYYLLMLPRWLHSGSQSFSAARRTELAAFAARDLDGPAGDVIGRRLLARILPSARRREGADETLDALLVRLGFDYEHHEALRRAVRAGELGLAKNRLPLQTTIEDAREGDVTREEHIGPSDTRVGQDALRNGAVAVVTLAAGSGTRWSQGAGTVKALCAFAKLQGRFRTFIDVHLAKTRRTGLEFGTRPVHLFTTGHLTHAAIDQQLRRERLDPAGSVRLSPGRSIGLRLVPTVRDLEFSWKHADQRELEERKHKVRDSARRALRDWALRSGECADYRNNSPAQCVHPVGHWYEVANLLLNGTLRTLIDERPQLEHLMLHNIDTLGADLDPRWLGRHIQSGNALSFEVVLRRFEDKGGGLARAGGQLRLVESLAFPREEDENKLSYYNSMTTWITIDRLLDLFGLSRAQLDDTQAVRSAVRALSQRMPTYITLKEVRRRWSNAHEDTFWVTQFEKLWGDMSALPEAKTGYFLVSRNRGQQLKEVSQLDTWHRDGSREHVESLCEFEHHRSGPAHHEQPLDGTPLPAE